MEDENISPRQRKRLRRNPPEPGASGEPGKGGRRVPVIWVAVVAAGLIAAGAVLVAWDLINDDDSSATVAPAPTATPDYQLKLESANCSPTQEGMQLDGSVSNISGDTFTDVAVVGLFLDSRGEVAARAVAELAPTFPPGEARPFNVNASQAGLSTCVVTFYLASGEKLLVDESVIPDAPADPEENPTP